MPVEAPPAPPAAPATPPPAPPAPAKSNLETAFSALEERAKPLSAENPPIPDHPAQKAAKEQRAREEAEAKKQREARETTEDEPGEEGETQTDEQKAEAQREEAARLESERKAKETNQPPKKKGDFLRDELAKVKSERDNFKSEVEKLKNAPRTEDPEKKSLQEKVAAMEKRQAEIEDEYRLFDYERHPEYKEKFLKPYQDAFNRGRQKTMSLEFTTADGTTRAATAEDFDTLMSIQNDAQAIRYAKEVFGDGYPAVIHHRERVLEANELRANAVNEAKTTGATKMKEMEELTTKQREAIRSRFMKTIEQREQKQEEIKEIDGDTAWNEAVARGKNMADRSYLNRDGKTPEEQAEIDAANYVRSRAYSPLRLMAKRQKAEIDALKKELAKYKGSEPGNGEGKADPEGKAPPPANSMDGAFADIERRAKPVTGRFY